MLTGALGGCLVSSLMEARIRVKVASIPFNLESIVSSILVTSFVSRWANLASTGGSRAMSVGGWERFEEEWTVP